MKTLVNPPLTKAEIEAALIDLSSFRKMFDRHQQHCQERMEAEEADETQASEDPEYQESLQGSQYVLFGKLLLHHSGQCLRLHYPYHSYNEMMESSAYGKVETLSEVNGIRAGQGLPTSPIFANKSIIIPPDKIICSQCHQGWQVSQLGEVVAQKSRSQAISLHPFIGLTLGEVVTRLNIIPDAFYGLYEKPMVMNERYIPDGQFYREGEEEGVDGGYVVEEGDVGIFQVRSYAHFQCERARLTVEGIKHFADIFHQAGFRDMQWRAIPHGHFPHETAMKVWPWYEAVTKIGTIRVGWQTSIININWSDATARDLEYLFATEKVTKGPSEVHANNEKQAADFLARIRTVLVDRL